MCTTDERQAAIDAVNDCLSNAYPGATGAEGAIADKIDLTETWDAKGIPGTSPDSNYFIPNMYGDCDVCR